MDTRERIIEHAFSQFLCKGYTSVEINPILNDLNITNNDFKDYFKNKEELLKAVAERYFLTQLDTMKKITECAQNFEDFIEGIKHLVDEHVDVFYDEENKCSSNYSMVDAMKILPEAKKDISDFYINTIRNVKMLIERCVEKGEIKKDTESSLLSLQLFTQLEGAYLIKSLNNKKLHKQEIFDAFDKIYNSVKYAS